MMGECHVEDSSVRIGALGSVVIGLLTGFFSPDKISKPINTPVPSSASPIVHNLLSHSVIFGSIAWRVAKRTILGTFLFTFLECGFKEAIPKQRHKYQGSIAAGAVCGAIFGLRGGLPGATVGMILFSSLPAARELYRTI